VPVAYVPGLVMRRAADLYPGEAKTDRRDAFVLAGTARTRRRQVHWLDTRSDELLDTLRVLNGFDVDLTRVTNRLRDVPTSISPALERALGTKLSHAGVRDLLAHVPDPDRAAHRGTRPDHRQAQETVAADRRQGHRRGRHSAGRADAHSARRDHHRSATSTNGSSTRHSTRSSNRLSFEYRSHVDLPGRYSNLTEQIDRVQHVVATSRPKP